MNQMQEALLRAGLVQQGDIERAEAQIRAARESEECASRTSRRMTKTETGQLFDQLIDDTKVQAGQA